MDHIIDLQLNVIASDGEIPKYWDENREYLYKARSIFGGYSIESEWVSSRIAALLGVDTVIYDMVECAAKLNGKTKIQTLSRCKTFLDEKYITLDTPANIYTGGNMERFLLKYFANDIKS